MTRIGDDESDAKSRKENILRRVSEVRTTNHEPSNCRNRSNSSNRHVSRFAEVITSETAAGTHRRTTTSTSTTRRRATAATETP